MNDRAWSELISAYPWPERRPAAEWKQRHGWLSPETEAMLRKHLPECRYVIELGSWLGASARFILSQSDDLRIVCIDTWEGDSLSLRAAPLELREIVGRGKLYDAFVWQCWRFRKRLIAVRARTTIGMVACWRAGLSPDLVYIDACHKRESVQADVRVARSLFPRATLVGDDWYIRSVKEGVQDGLGAEDWEKFGQMQAEWTNKKAWSFVP